MRSLWAAGIVLAAATLLARTGPQYGQFAWPDSPRKAPLRFRVVAVALADPRSSYFSSHEVLIAETEIAHDEWSLIKVVYNFLPYQPRLSETGFDYSVIYEFSAARNDKCDESLDQITAIQSTTKPPISLRYAQDSPLQDLEGRRTKPLPCYETSASDFSRSVRQPIPPDKPSAPEPDPALKRRPAPQQ